MTIRHKRVGRIRRTELSGYGETADEAALSRLFAPYAGTGQALYIDSSATCWRGAAPSDAPFAAAAEEDAYSGGFIGLDRAGGRRWTIGASGRHPVLTTDSGRPALAFGRDGLDPNQLSPTTNGDIIAASVVDPFGSEVSARPLFQAGTGYSVFAKFRSGKPSGVFLGSALDGDDAFVFGTHPDTGQLFLKNRVGVDGLLMAGDSQTGSVYTVIGTYDPNGGVASMTRYGNGPDVTVTATGVVDVIGGNGTAAMPKIGGYGATVSGVPYNGYLFALGYLPSPVLNDPLKRVDLLTMLAAK